MLILKVRDYTYNNDENSQYNKEVARSRTKL